MSGEEAALPATIEPVLERAARGGKILFLTGAGVSAESGIPTFRGEEGYWKVGSRNYHPQELATREAFLRMPDEVWAWYLHRRSVCRAASPNAAHLALARLESALGGRFALVTQNVDGLHLRAGSTPERTLEIHGDIDFLRCSRDCGPRGRKRNALSPVPDAISLAWPKERRLADDERALLHCERCGEWTRPHVLWFDEFYEEDLYRSESALALAHEATLLVVAGTSGQTTLPFRIVTLVAARSPVVVVNLDASPFSEHALASGGADLRGKAATLLPLIARRLSGS